MVEKGHFQELTQLLEMINRYENYEYRNVVDTTNLL